MKIKLINEPILNNYAEELLHARGIEDIDSFLNPTEEHLNDWRLLDNIEEGIQLLEKTIGEGGKTLLVVDPDMDGFCSSTLVWNWIRTYSPDFELDYFVHDGKQHGLEDVVRELDLNNYALVILPDAATNDDEHILKYPNTQFLIIDHHERTESLDDFPKNAVLINNQTSENYPNKTLCGAGVTWQFIRALDNHFNTSLAAEMTDLVAFATVADMMELVDMENRYILDRGLNNVKNLFLKEILKKQSYSLGDGPLTPTGISFYVAPLINAMCRVGTLDEKKRMFLAFTDGDQLVPNNKRGSKPGDMERAATESVRECVNARSRQVRLQDKMAEAAEVRIQKFDLLENKILAIVLDESFDEIPSEINGLTAQRMARKYNRPTIIVRENDEGYLRGSARGLDNVDMMGLREFFLESDLFEYAEGHSNAFGCSLQKERLKDLHKWANQELADVDFNEGVWEVDFIRNGIDEDIKYIVYDLEKYIQTWGKSNTEPLIAIINLHVNKNNIEVIGKKKDTIKITKNGVVYMFFKCSPEEVEKLTQYPNAVFTIVGEMNVNEFMNNITPQIFVRAYEIADGSLAF